MTDSKDTSVINAPINPDSAAFKAGYKDFQDKQEPKYGLSSRNGYWKRLNEGVCNLGWFGDDAAYARDYVDGFCQAEFDSY
jgi:hypothetical protein